MEGILALETQDCQNLVLSVVKENQVLILLAIFACYRGPDTLPSVL